MDTLVQGYGFSGPINGLKFDPKLFSAFTGQNLVNGFKLDDAPILDHNGFANPGDSSPSLGANSDGSSQEEGDFSDAILKYISQMLMEEEDLEHKPCMFQDCLALQAAEKSFYDLLGEKYPPSSSENRHPPSVLDQDSGGSDDDFGRTHGNAGSSRSNAVGNIVEPSLIPDPNKFEYLSARLDQTPHWLMQSIGSSNNFDFVDRPPLIGSLSDPFRVLDPPSESQLLWQYSKAEDSNLVQVDDLARNGSRGRKNHYREDSDDFVEANRSSKQLASSADDFEEQLEMYDKVLLCPNWRPHLLPDSNCASEDESQNSVGNHKLEQNGNFKGSHGGRPRGKRRGSRREAVDLGAFLTQCAQNVASNDSKAASELLKRIRQHSSPYGDSFERVAHFLANALEARLAGTGRAAAFATLATTRISAAQILRAYQAFVTACPFLKLSNFFANRSIGKLAKNASSIHIIDFGILYGFQWPCLIQRLSVRPGGPPNLRITGIEFPQPGLRPTERVEETGRRLRNYCERFGVPFEYSTIAQKWETIELEDLRINRDEVLIVNCLYRLRNVPDETLVMNSPRDSVLKLIRRINPDLFVHGVVSGTYNAPFFITRFRETLFHFSSLFDMFEATVPREDQDRLLLEQEVFGREIMNVIACEGTERVQRPETYKQWQVRNQRAGFRQLPLDKEIVGDVRAKVKSGYHKDFVVDEYGDWMLQGWKGRVLYAISCWRPAEA